MRALPNSESLRAGLLVARDLFDRIGACTFDGVGFTRAAYGEGEDAAHELIARVCQEHGFAVRRDAALNLYVKHEGQDPENVPCVLVGSHLDAVAHGGNFDGLAGVLAGLASLVAFKHAGLRTLGDLVLLATRAEESAWFGAQHVGSRALLGMLDSQILDIARRSDTGRSLREHMVDAGADIESVLSGAPMISLESIGSFLELHIEQGPVLASIGKSVGIVTDIRGNVRCRRILCRGSYGHSGAEPRSLRRDAVFAASELVMRMDALWTDLENQDQDVVMTFGRFATDPDKDGVTVVPGEVALLFDARSHESHVLELVEKRLHSNMEEIGKVRQVQFTCDRFTGDPPIRLSRDLTETLMRGCKELSIPTARIASGGGHDAGDFAVAGIPSAMIFVRSVGGSHNPDEKMDFGDFEQGVRLMTWFLAEAGNHDGKDT